MSLSWGNDDPDECSDLLGLLGCMDASFEALGVPPPSWNVMKSRLVGPLLSLVWPSTDPSCLGVGIFMGGGVTLPPTSKWMSLLWLLLAPAVTAVFAKELLGIEDPRGMEEPLGVVALDPLGVVALLGGSSFKTKFSKESRSWRDCDLLFVFEVCLAFAGGAPRGGTGCGADDGGVAGGGVLLYNGCAPLRTKAGVGCTCDCIGCLEP